MKRIAVVAGVAAAYLFSLSSAQAQGSPATCSFNGGTATLTVSVDLDPAVLSVVSRQITLDGAACGAATVDNTDSIVVNGGSLDDTVTLRGRYRPGLTAETDGASEIEFSFALGGGADTVKVNQTGSADIVTFGDGGIDVGSDGDQDLTTTTVEAVRVYGQGGNDTIDASAYVWGPVYLYGGGGDDTLVGGSGDDTLYGNAGNDAVHGGPGNDSLLPGSGDDLVFGEAGDDTLSSDSTPDGADELYGGPGSDTLSYTTRTGALTVTIGNGLPDDGEAGELDLVDSDVENVSGGKGSDTITGSPSGNTLRGGSGNDILNGGDGIDFVYGGPGIDTVYGGPGNDVLNGDADNDELRGGAGNDSLFGDDQDDSLYGDTGADHLSGGSGNDTVRGGGGDDIVDGDGGNDTVYGGDGQDLTFGGPGNDILYGFLDGIEEGLFCEGGVDSFENNGEDNPILCELQL